MEIIPALLVKTKAELIEKIAALEPYVERAHIDVADGIFVDNTTIGADEVEDLDTPLRLSVHLMVSKPENHIVRWLTTPADTFIFHAEATTKAQEIIEKVKERDGFVGVALNPGTPTSLIEDYLNSLDFVQFMTVEPGFYGSPFIESVIQKIKDFHYFYPDMQILVDGGVTPVTAPALIEAGAQTLVVGSYIFKDNDAEKALSSFIKT